jgi:hypothetical protein
MHSRGRFADEALFRVGAGVLGLFAGFIIGLLLFVPLALANVVVSPLASFLFACAVAGALCGAVAPNAAIVAFEGVVHFFFGIFSALAGGDAPSFQDAPRWLVAAFGLACSTSVESGFACIFFPCSPSTQRESAF